MDASIALILVQDGVVNGAVYALLALSLVLVFTVTRVILIPQGEIVAYGALSYAALCAGSVPRSVWLLAALGAAAFVAAILGDRHRRSGLPLLRLAGETLAWPAAVWAIVDVVAPTKPSVLVSALLTVALVAPMSLYVYRLAFQPLARASVLVLLVAAVGVHLVLGGVGLVIFGPEGFRATAFSDAFLSAGDVAVSGQSIWVVGVTLALIATLFAFFELTLLGRALRATAVNRVGARLVGIPTAQAGRFAFGMAGVIGAVSGVLIAPLTTVYYDSGFLIGLKGFVAAIVGGLASYPAAALAAVVVGLVESFSSFWASAFKEVIVFTVIIPVLLWRSLRAPPVEDEE